MHYRDGLVDSGRLDAGESQDQAVHEADLRMDDIVGAHQPGVQGEPNAPAGNEVLHLLLEYL